MPPKKRRLVNPAAQPGVAKQYLEKNFSSFPREHDEVRNGHLLYVYVTSGQYSRAECDRQLKTLVISNLGSQYAEADYCFKADIKRIVDRSLDKYKHLQRAGEFEKFVAVCEETFNVKPVQETDVAKSSPHGQSSEVTSPQPGSSRAHSPQPGTSHDVRSPEPYTPVTSVSTGVSTRTTRSRDIETPRKAKLRKRLEFVSSVSWQRRQKYKSLLKVMKKRMKSPKRVVNQALQRKVNIIAKQHHQIQELQRLLNESELAKELKKIKKTHQKTLTFYHRKVKYMVPITKHQEVCDKLKDKDETIKSLEHNNLLLKEELSEHQGDAGTSSSKADGKVYSSNMRMKVYDCISNKVPTANIPSLLTKLQQRNQQDVTGVPKRSTVEMMARELGAIAELQTAEEILKNSNVTMGFDATTQEEQHINSIHFTTENRCFCASVEELAGGTAEDYAQHVFETVDSLSATYTYFHEDADYPETRKAMIDNIANSMTDRCAANHAAITVVNREWGKYLNELNCHLHPLDSVASSVRAALKKLEESRGSLFGKDCLAANVILQMNKLRYKNSKGDPRGFVAFLDDKGIPRGVLPRYRGNRLHILFHIAGKLIEYYDDFVTLLSSGTSCGGLRKAILKDFMNPTTKNELHVLGLLGKLLSGPWMKKFYTSASTEINHVDGIEVVKQVLENLRQAAGQLGDLAVAERDFFGDELVDDSTLSALRKMSVDPQFNTTMQSCLDAIVAVLQRQYQKYFGLDITEKLKEETASARSHNMDAEEIMGMFSALKMKSPHATMSYISCRMRATKNRTIDYLDGLAEEKREDILKKVIKFTRQERSKKKLRQKEVRNELIQREKAKEQERDTKERKKLEKRLKDTDLGTIRNEFPELDYSKIHDIEAILEGKVVGRRACHVWYEDGKLVVYNAKVEKIKTIRKTKKYRIAYWSQAEEYDDATDFYIPLFSLAADALHGDFAFC